MLNKDIINLKNLVKLSVKQLHNKNQFVIYFNDSNGNKVIAFQSYHTLIAIYHPIQQKLFINYHYWDYSKTTLKHLKLFINEYTTFDYYTKAGFIGEIKRNDNIIFFSEN